MCNGVLEKGSPERRRTAVGGAGPLRAQMTTPAEALLTLDVVDCFVRSQGASGSGSRDLA